METIQREFLNNLLPKWKWKFLDNGVDVIECLSTVLDVAKKHYPSCFDYLNYVRESTPIGRDMIDESHRKMLCDWTLPIIDYFGFNREVAYVFAYFLDRTTSGRLTRTTKLVSPHDYQRIAITCLNLSIKLHGEVGENEEIPIIVAMKTFVSLGQGRFTVEEVEEEERDILSLLDWHVNPPTPLSFIKSFTKLLPTSWESVDMREDLSIAAFIFAFAVYLTEVALDDSSLSFRFRAHEIAYAAIQCGLDAFQVSQDSIPCICESCIEPPPREVGVTLLNLAVGGFSMTVDRLRTICHRLKDLFLASRTAKLKRKKVKNATKRKAKKAGKTQDKASSKPDLIPEDLLAFVASHWKSTLLEDCCSFVFDSPSPPPLPHARTTTTPTIEPPKIVAPAGDAFPDDSLMQWDFFSNNLGVSLSPALSVVPPVLDMLDLFEGDDGDPNILPELSFTAFETGGMDDLPPLLSANDYATFTASVLSEPDSDTSTDDSDVADRLSPNHPETNGDGKKSETIVPLHGVDSIIAARSEKRARDVHTITPDASDNEEESDKHDTKMKILKFISGREADYCTESRLTKKRKLV